MRKVFSLFICSFFVLLTTSFSFAGTPVETTIAPMLQKILPAVVNIRAKIKVTDFNTLLQIQRERQQNSRNNNDQSDDSTSNLNFPTTYTSVGSGVIIEANHGYILTNAHVVADATTITVTLGDGRHFTAKTIGIDKPSDVALIQIKAKNLSALTMADSSKLQVGDFVAAIGNPFGLNQSVTSGIVSALGRNTLGIENYENFIQTDAPINPGNSGGALINMKGELVGINTAILSAAKGNIGIGFAIPANMVKSVMVQLLQYGDVKRGLLGIGAEDITPELANAFHLSNSSGAAVTQVLPYSPAQLGGMQTGDIIVAINGIPTKSASDVINTIGFLRVDSKANIEVIRNNKPVTVTVTLTDPAKRKLLAQKSDPFFYGVALKNFDITSPLHGDVQGVLVVTVDEDSAVWQADIRPGDIITSINQQKITNIHDLHAAASKADKQLLVNVIRNNNSAFVLINRDS